MTTQTGSTYQPQTGPTACTALCHSFVRADFRVFIFSFQYRGNSGQNVSWKNEKNEQSGQEVSITNLTLGFCGHITKIRKSCEPGYRPLVHKLPAPHPFLLVSWRLVPEQQIKFSTEVPIVSAYSRNRLYKRIRLSRCMIHAQILHS